MFVKTIVYAKNMYTKLGKRFIVTANETDFSACIIIM